MSFNQHRNRDDRRWGSEQWELRRRERDSWTDIAYLIVAGLGLVLLARLWSRVIQPWAAGLAAQLSVTQLVTAALALLLVLVIVVRLWVTHRRRRAARGLRVVNLPPTLRSHRPDGQRREEPGAAAGSRVAVGHRAATRSALDAARSRAHAAARVGGSLVRIVENSRGGSRLRSDDDP